MMEYNSKTAFILNHTNHFSKPSGDELLLESGTKNASTKCSFSKSIWSNTVDAVLQYCRIVFDLFSHEKPLWSVFTNEGPPSEFELDMNRCSAMPCMETACSMLQMLKPCSGFDSEGGCVDATVTVGYNVGRVIVISAHMKDQISSWIPDILATLEKPVNSKGYASVDASEWIFIDILDGQKTNDWEEISMLPKLLETPPTIKSNGTHRFLYMQLPSTSLELYHGLMQLVESHYSLASTMVQDIPMKEEANTSNSSSAMYGVELLHRADAHALLRCTGLTDHLTIRTPGLGLSTQDAKASTLQRPNSGFSKTLGIKWVTPKSTDFVSIRYATKAFRVTLADIGNRASACLAQFVLGGRCVALAHRLPTDLFGLLESSHHTGIPSNEALFLTCHGSVMYIHALATVCPLAHPPITEIDKCEKVNRDELRIKAFVDQIILPSRLAPASAHQQFTVTPRERAQHHLERSTRYWPLIESYTFLGSNKVAVVLFEHLSKEFLEVPELNACKKSIDKLATSIRLNVALADNGKGSLKRSAPQLPVAPFVQAEAIGLAVELDHMLSLHAKISTEHAEIEKHWHDSVGFSHGTRALIKSDEFQSLSLCEMIKVARTTAMEIGEGLAPSIGVPESLLKVLGQLKLLSKQLSGTSKLNGTNSVAFVKLKPGQSKMNSKEPIVLEPADINVFLDLLQPNKRPKMGKTRPDFAGISTADPKGQCQLYRALREKEKDENAT